MKCPNCGAEMKSGMLFCEQCGEDIHIVPDFEPQVEADMEQALLDIAVEMEPETLKEASLRPEPEEALHDWDQEQEEEQGHTLRPKLLVVLATGIVLLAIAIFAIVSWNHYNSYDHQLTKARECVDKADYDEAITYYERALVLVPNDITVQFELADVYFEKNNKMEYEYLLREIITNDAATSEQLQSAYGKLIAIYDAREDYASIDELLDACTHLEIVSQYESYMAPEPEFSLAEGYYTSALPLKLLTSGTGSIYYTMDGSDPDEDSSLYTAPIVLDEEGEYCIKAVYINERGIASDIVTKTYHIEIDLLDAPNVSTVSSEYNRPMDIEIGGNSSNIYYTTDGSDPTIHSTHYTGPIPMPVGKTTYRFIRLFDDKKSQIVERTYTLTLNTDITTTDAVIRVREYEISTGRIYDSSGTFDDSGSAYLYEYQYVKSFEDMGDFYVVAEILRDPEGTLAKNGNYYGVDVYQGTLYQLIFDEKGQNPTFVLLSGLQDF